MKCFLIYIVMVLCILASDGHIGMGGLDIYKTEVMILVSMITLLI